MKPKHNVFWFTGLSGAGKTTVATAVLQRLEANGKEFALLDGDIMRKGLNKDLSFTIADREENIRRVAEVSKLFVDVKTSCLCTFISPTEKIREMAKDIIGADRFYEIYINTPLSVCEKRDPKGLYKEVRKGNIVNFTGIDSVYEQPKSPDFVLDCVNNSLEESVIEVLEFIEKKRLNL